MREAHHLTQVDCRCCGESSLAPVLSLGDIPLADALQPPGESAADAARYPLEVTVCTRCWLMQITTTIPPEELYCREYPYFSSFSPQWIEHNRENVERLIAAERLGAGDVVIEVASNDGYLLRHFLPHGIPVLGIDPARGPAQAAREIGVPTREEFFGLKLARRLRSEGLGARVLFANNVLAHATDTNDFVAGIRHLLEPDGIASIEFPYVVDLIQHNEFDTIYHEHLCYFSLHALNTLFTGHDLVIHDVERLVTHGGSLRLHVSHNRPREKSVTELLAEEARLGVNSLAFYDRFGERVRAVCDQLRRILRDLKDAGARIAAYGAAAKGATLLNAAALGREFIDFVVDRNTHKHGLLMPGLGIPIQPTDCLCQESPDYVLLLAWNFKDEILRQQRTYIEQGGRFIVPIPEPAILDRCAA